MTPAMATGITDHIRSARELLESAKREWRKANLVVQSVVVQFKYKRKRDILVLVNEY